MNEQQLRALTVAYDEAINKLQDTAQAQARIAIEKVFSQSGLTTEELFERTKRAILEASYLPRKAAGLEVENFLHVAEGKEINTSVRSGSYSHRVEKELLKYASNLENPAKFDKFKREAASIASDLVSAKANNQMLSRSPGFKRKFARVPMHDAKVCPWCIMLASRGFVYNTAHSAGEFNAYHARCRCRVLPEGAANSVGYDDELYTKLYELDLNNSYGRSAEEQIRRRKDQLRIFGFEGDLDGIENSVFYEATGIPAKVDYRYKPKEKCSPYERKVYKTLANVGLDVVVNYQDDGARGNIDCKVNGANCELKNIISARPDKVRKRLSEANKQIIKTIPEDDKLIILSSFDSSLSDECVWSEIVKNHRYYDYCLYVTKNGKIRFREK